MVDHCLALRHLVDQQREIQIVVAAMVCVAVGVVDLAALAVVAFLDVVGIEAVLGLSLEGQLRRPSQQWLPWEERAETRWSQCW